MPSINFFFDNYFTGLNLLIYSSGNNISAIKTIWKNPREKYSFTETSSWKNKPRENHINFSCKNITLVKWKNNSVVTVASNFENNVVVMTSLWWNEFKTKKHISLPKI